MFDRAYHLAERLLAAIERLCELLEEQRKERESARR